MGQYYNVVLKNKDNRVTYLDRYMIANGERRYTMAKLTEHSWIGNDFVTAVCEKLYNKPQRVMWLGDYSDEYMEDHPNGINELSIKDFNTHYARSWRSDTPQKALRPVEFDVLDTFLVDHTKRVFLNMSDYYKNSVMMLHGAEWCLHPLPILTCIGNGLGGGDYTAVTSDSTAEHIGALAWDKISFEDERPADYKELCVIFKEKGWNEQ